MGDEAGCAAKKGVVTSVNRGKVYFIAWSMDVKIEGENAVRHLDMTTHNHASPTCNTPSWPYTDRIAMAKGLKSCENELKAVEQDCKPDKKGDVKCPKPTEIEQAEAMPGGPEGSPAWRKRQDAINAAHMSYEKKIRKISCNKAARCMLVPWDKQKCCAPQTPHHLVPKAGFFKDKFVAKVDGKRPAGAMMKGCSKYDEDAAPCICATGGKASGAHGLVHAKQADLVIAKFGGKRPPTGTTYSCGEAEDIGAEAVEQLFPECSKKCIKAQLRRIHRSMEVESSTEVKVEIEQPQASKQLYKSWGHSP